MTTGDVEIVAQSWLGLRNFYHVRSLYLEGERAFRDAAAQFPARQSSSDKLPVYLVCYQVLRINDDPHAEPVLSTAHHLLQTQAASIDDEQLRESFLNRVTANREIAAADCPSVYVSTG